MRRVLFACLTVTLIAGAVYSVESAVSSHVASPRLGLPIASPHPGLPIASIGEVFKHF